MKENTHMPVQQRKQKGIKILKACWIYSTTLLSFREINLQEINTERVRQGFIADFTKQLSIFDMHAKT